MGNSPFDEFIETYQFRSFLVNLFYVMLNFYCSNFLIKNAFPIPTMSFLVHLSAEFAMSFPKPIFEIQCFYMQNMYMNNGYSNLSEDYFFSSLTDLKEDQIPNSSSRWIQQGVS